MIADLRTVIETAACYFEGHRDDENSSRRSSRRYDQILSPPNCLMYISLHARAVFGLILGEIPDPSWEGIRTRVIYVSLRDTFHVFVSCGDRILIAEIPVCRIAHREVNLGAYLRVGSYGRT